MRVKDLEPLVGEKIAESFEDCTFRATVMRALVEMGFSGERFQDLKDEMENRLCTTVVDVFEKHDSPIRSDPYPELSDAVRAEVNNFVAAGKPS